MKQVYYRNEYTSLQWKALINKAEEMSCQVAYGRYGDRATIDSTDLENAIIAQTNRDERDRLMWAEKIHEKLVQAVKA